VGVFFTFYGLTLLLKDIEAEVSPLGNPAMPMKMPFGSEEFQKINWPIPDDLLADLRSFRERLDSDQHLTTALNTLLAPREVVAVRRCCDRLLKSGCFPDPGPGRNFPWPPL
jgi:hypothetical protein